MHPPAHTIDIKELHLEFNFRMQQKLHEVQELLLQFSQNQNADDILLQLHSIFLALGNTSKSLGLDTHSKLANDMGSLASNLLIRNESPEPVVDKMAALLNQMMRISNDNQAKSTVITTENALSYPLNTTKQGHQEIIATQNVDLFLESSTDPLIMLQMTASSDALELIGRFQQQGYQAQCFTDFESLIDQLCSQTPSGILLDLDTFPDQPTGQLIGLLDNLHKHHCTIGFLSSSDHFGARLKAVRLLCDAFFVKPADITAIHKRFNCLLLNRTQNPCRILIIEPRRQQSQQLKQHCLKMCRCEVMEVNAYYESLTRAIEFKPDLAIIATDQDGAHGKDVATILKHYESLMHLPCLFVGSHKSEPTLQKSPPHMTAVLHYDDPDFLNNLLLSLEEIIPQQRYLQEQLFFDPLTGVLLERKFLEQLEGMASAAKRYGSLLNCALIDIDHLNQVNRQHGFWIGDRVIRQLANILTKRLRRSDLIARVGDNRFAVIMPNTTLNNASKVITTLKDNFGLLPHATLGNTFYCSFSAGISSFPQFENISELLAHAERNLITAKNSGRNRINHEV